MKSFDLHASMRNYNTFRIEAYAGAFARFSDVGSLVELLSTASQGKEKLPLLILGGGSNVLFTKDFEGTVLKNEIKGIQKVDEDNEFVFVQAGAGEEWHQFVLYCIDKGYGGVENLSLIPGSVGAAPMQNIGAYGVELQDVFHELKAFNIEEKTNYTFKAKDCDFGYRESVFKNKYRDQFVILNVTFKLRKVPVLNTSYGAIEAELKRMGVTVPTIKSVSDAVINIRKSKLPDPAVIGNAGSFFKNPVISAAQFLALQITHPGIVGHATTNDEVKLAAGWLIEQCGWKGYREGDAACHENQALVLVNYGNATGEQIYALSEKILISVKEKFSVRLQREVNMI